ncbi:hypothetical protein BU24DRAFT_9145 [Aaosphaeria arxii CBS 175.79]|uniref:Rhodopsin domain-containing protein n=1 Tax=Aaosphaeria arxii CBS 175.79 TaxID=1450172 RepID=A0A6A5Y7Q0_9PLEO|nr:uncharacterized protein BU24DRAFT_9145 [Aaosphaeria arxii CBS 175.79]KAF2020830.1 hypothetical protein BU24DRAFT_9145 [Aaosphaeria arxii CBS 175.79]
MILPRTLYSDVPPERRTRVSNNPTLLYSWWCTIFSLVIIGFRISGRYIRNERLFREDKIMAFALLPLLARMGCIHVVLIYGTNNVDADGLTDPVKIHRREIGAKLVLAARIFYALFIWTAKFTVSEFLKRMTERFWKRGYEFGLRGIRVFLAVTFVAVVIATLSECRPFNHYWQVIPDPGPQCRQGYAHLLTMGITDIITDLLLIFFPIPIIMRSGMGKRRKASLIALFSLSFALIAITGARIPLVIHRRGIQQFRTVFASSEILAAALVSNAIILGSFLRDRGPKKPKYKPSSATDSMDRRSSRRQTLQQWGSDEDLARSLGFRANPELVHEQDKAARPAPKADVGLLSRRSGQVVPFNDSNWNFPPAETTASRESGGLDPTARAVDEPLVSPRGARRVSFYDVGGLLENGQAPSPTDSVIAHDFATQQPRRGSRASIPTFSSSRTTLPSARRSSRVLEESQDHELAVRNSQQAAGPVPSETQRSAIEEETVSPTPERQRSPRPSRPPATPMRVRSPTQTSFGSLPSLKDAGGLLSKLDTR